MRGVDADCIVHHDVLVLRSDDDIESGVGRGVWGPSVYLEDSEEDADAAMTGQDGFGESHYGCLVAGGVAPVHSVQVSVVSDDCLLYKLFITGPLRTYNSLWDVTTIQLVPSLGEWLTVTFS